MTLAEYRKSKEAPHAESAHDAGAHAERHPDALEYAKIGTVLGIITAIEIAIYYLGLSHTALVLFLLALSAIKFSMVVLWFMHLKFDHRLFSSMFLIGLVLAMIIFTIALSTIGGKLV